MEREKKKKSKEKEIGVITKKNKRTWKEYEKEVESTNFHPYTPKVRNYEEVLEEDLYFGYSEPLASPKTLQEYLDNKCPTKADKEKVREVLIEKINQERDGLELLEGGELDLREYVNIDWINIDGELLKTPLVKINLEGLEKVKGYCYLLNNSFDFSQAKTLWDYKFLPKYDYKYSKKTGYSAFSLIKVEELNSFAYRLNEDNWQDPNFIKHFGIGKGNIEFLKVNSEEMSQVVYTLLDNLANQIIARCVIISNRLTHGTDNEDESKIMELALGFQKCDEIEKTLKETDRRKIKGLVDKVLAGDKELASRLQKLPWEVKQLETRIEYQIPGSWPSKK